MARCLEVVVVEAVGTFDLPNDQANGNADDEERNDRDDRNRPDGDALVGSSTGAIRASVVGRTKWRY